MIEVGSRARVLPAPPPVVRGALVEPRRPGARPWLVLLPDEVEPEVLAAEEPDRVVWSSLWPSRPDDQVHFTLTPAGNGGTSLRFVLRSAFTRSGSNCGAVVHDGGTSAQ
ncbi:hypothetical protein ACFV4N_33610 [Actinosynnema sp. NPDC059797]